MISGGNAESNHYIDPGDSCYIAEVYTNGFVKVQYPVAGGKRWAYAKASDFSISKKQENKLPDTRLSVWFSLSPMGMAFPICVLMIVSIYVIGLRRKMENC